MKKAGWMLLVFSGLLALMVDICLAQEVKGSRDHPLFSRMPGYTIQRYEEKTFEAHPFRMAVDKVLQVEGRFVQIRYALKTGAKEPSRLEILRNYESAIAKIGGSVLFRDDEGNSYLKVAKDGKEIWAHVNAYITDEFTVFIIEKQAMAQSVVANAKVFADDIRNTGHAAREHMKNATYGICIDCGDAVAYERLAAYPTAKRCLGCQQQRERTYAHQGTPRL